MASFCHIMKEEKKGDSKEFILDYLVSLLDDAADFFLGGDKSQPRRALISGN